MVFIQPQIIDCQEQRFHPFPFNEVQEGSDFCDQVKCITLYHTMAFPVHPVEVSALHTVVPCLIAGFTLFVTIFLTDVIFWNRFLTQ